MKVIHDCDPGPDDAVALMLSLSSSSWEVDSITTVSGNIRVEQCAMNARKIVSLCGKSVPVYLGSQKPLLRKPHTLESIFTNSGMPGGEYLDDNVSLSTSEYSAIDFLVDRLSRPYEGGLTICATGPLTNIAAVIQKDSSLSQNIDHLVIMGGCYFPEPIRGEMGNFSISGVSGKSEFNFAIDPEAAQIVISSDIKKISVIGLNLTRKILFNTYWCERFNSVGNNVSVAAAKILRTVSESHFKDLGHLRSSETDPVRAVHDAINVVYMERPDLFETQEFHVKIETGETSLVAGTSLISDQYELGYSKKKIHIVRDASPKAVFEHMCECFARYDI